MPLISVCCPKICRATSTIWAAAIAWRSTAPRVVVAGDRRALQALGGMGRRSTGFVSTSRPLSAGCASGFDAHAPMFAALAEDPVLVEGQADRGALGHRPRRLSAWGVRRTTGASGTTAFATPPRRYWRGDSQHARGTRDATRRLARCILRRVVARPRASTSSSRTTASLSPIWSPTSTSTTRRTAKAIGDGTDDNHVLEPRRRRR